MNVLKNYSVKIQGYTLPMFSSILNETNNRFVLENKTRIFTIKDTDTNKVDILKCVANSYTNREDNKAIKVANNNSKCYKIVNEFNITCTSYQCQECHKSALDLYNRNLLKILKK